MKGIQATNADTCMGHLEVNGFEMHKGHFSENGYPKEILYRIGEPYLIDSNKSLNKQSGLGLGIFTGKTLLEKNFAVVKCKNSDLRKGAELSLIHI